MTIDKVQLKSDESPKKRVLYLMIDRIMIGGIIAIIGIIGSIWIEQGRLPREERIQAMEENFVKALDKESGVFQTLFRDQEQLLDQKLDRIEKTYQEKVEEDAIAFQQFSARQRQTFDDFKQDFDSFKVDQESRFRRETENLNNLIEIQANRLDKEEKKLREYIDFEMETRGNQIERRLSRRGDLTERRMPVYQEIVIEINELILEVEESGSKSTKLGKQIKKINSLKSEYSLLISDSVNSYLDKINELVSKGLSKRGALRELESVYLKAQKAMREELLI